MKFLKMDPIDYEVNITERDTDNKRTSYSIDIRVSMFDDCIRLARILDIDINDYRKKIISLSLTQ